MTFPNREIVAALRAEYPAGTRVKLLKIKYIPEVYYGNKLIWKNPNFANT